MTDGYKAIITIVIHVVSGHKLLLQCMRVASTFKFDIDFKVSVARENLCMSAPYLHLLEIYRKRTNFRGHNISWVKFLRGLIFVGKSSPP